MKEELAYRENDGVAVRLFWHAGSNHLSVSVYDWHTGEWFELDADAQNAMDMFEHPYAYAALRDRGRELVRDALAA